MVHKIEGISVSDDKYNQIYNIVGRIKLLLHVERGRMMSTKEIKILMVRFDFPTNSVNINLVKKMLTKQKHIDVKILKRMTYYSYKGDE